MHEPGEYDDRIDASGGGGAGEDGGDGEEEREKGDASLVVGEGWTAGDTGTDTRTDAGAGVVSSAGLFEFVGGRYLSAGFIHATIL